ncbi:zinc finger CCCH domain-containing protein 46 [Phragmites australis]|uniref:zinc finger CCCH domain-containing protein 46 n=1 Tax=Phragmites australis TaxID=29695 RepID=UPI002D791ED4|nr:zinc finger CCCH domain-containing protein 46 [Phragmites australis]
MNRRQELCRNFQRGSCKYGAQCRFVHASSQQQQAKPNPFGFGTASRQQQQQPSLGAPFQQQQQQQQKPNPFGFGVQGAAAQSRHAPGPAKPFQNKWVRDPSAPTKQSEAAQPPPAAHTSCTDPESCRQQIADDFKNETPLWKLTCYAHLRSGPCDIKGDISFEELRAKAYEEGRQGHPLQSIVEGERNLQNAKLMEFTNFLNNPHISQTPSFSTMPTMPSVPEVKNNSSFGVSQTNGPPVFSSFSQIGAATNFGPVSRTTASGVPTNSLFGQPTQPNRPTFGAPTFGGSEMKFGVSGPFGSQTSKQPSGSLQGSSMSSVGNFPKSPAGYQQSPASSIQHKNIDRQSQDLLNGMMAPTSAINQAPVEDNKNENQDDSIWLKEKWSIGEIPLSEPPQRHISHVF